MMDYLLIDATYAKEVRLPQKVIDYLKAHKYRTLALYGAVQFLKKLPLLIKQLQDGGITVISSRPDRTHKEFQLLGCDCYYENLHLDKPFDAFLYIGDGVFHPRALVLSQKDLPERKQKPVLVYDPVTENLKVFTVTTIQDILNKNHIALKKLLMAEKIGILITVKPGQMHYTVSRQMEKKFQNKTIYYFVADSINLSDLEQFPFIDCWVNTACPRIGFDDALTIQKPIVNINDALAAERLVVAGEAVKKSKTDI